MLKSFLIFFIFIISLLIFVTSGFTERIYSHFDRLPLMREEAFKDRNERAIRNIDYVQNTQDGEYFEVDNERPPIEALVTKKTKIRQSKPLELKKDEDILIEYYKRIDAYAGNYNQIKNYWIAGKIGDYTAVDQFHTLFRKYSTFSSSVRAVGIIYLTKGEPQEATKFFKEAIKVNERDPIALMAESMAVFALGEKTESRIYLDKAKGVDPTLFFLSSWELNHIQRSKPKIYKDWAAYVDLKQ